MKELVALLAEVHDSPAAFWRLVLRGEPRRWQAPVCEEIRLRLEAGERHLRVLVRSAHGAGKTTLAVVLALWWTATRPHSRGLTTAPTWAAVEGVFWVELARLFGGSLLARAGFGRLLTTELSFEPGWDLVGLSTDHAVNLEGRHSPTSSVRVAGEAKAIEAGVFESTEALLDAPETLDVWISTPSIPSGPFFTRDVKGGADVVRRVVTIDDLIAEELPGKLDWRARRLEEWGENSPEYQSRALARYVSDAEGALFPFAWVERDTQASKGRALALVREHGVRWLAVDVIGIGKGLYDSLRVDFTAAREYRSFDKPRDPDRFANKKAETAWRLRSLLEAGRVRLPQSVTLKAQLLGMRYAITPQGKIRVVDPSDSPDHVDALLIALSRAVAWWEPGTLLSTSYAAPMQFGNLSWGRAPPL